MNIETTPQQINRYHHELAVADSLLRCMASTDWDAMERRAYQKHPIRPKSASPFLNARPVPQSIRDVGVTVAKQEMEKNRCKK